MPIRKSTRRASTGKKISARHADAKKPAGMKVCMHCGAVYFQGHWHNAPAIASLMLRQGPKHKEANKDELCHECRWLMHGNDPRLAPFGGQLTLDGLTDRNEKEAVMKTVRNAGTKAQKRNPLDHIIAIEDRGDRAVVTTTQNQLAVAIGKDVNAAFKGGRLIITFSENDLPARIHWTHKP